jgi:hypothetical protein
MEKTVFVSTLPGTHIGVSKKFFVDPICDSFLCPNTHFRVGRHKNKKSFFFHVGLRILLPIQNQLLETENPKFDSPYCTVYSILFVEAGS